MRDEHGLENGVRPGRGARQDDGAGMPGRFEGEVGGAVVAFELEGVGGGEESVEDCIAVYGRDAGGVRLRAEAGVGDVVDGV